MLAAPSLSDDPPPSPPLAWLPFGHGECPWRVPLRVLAGAGGEYWPAARAVSAGEHGFGQEGTVAWRSDGEHLFLALARPDDSLEEATERAYGAILDALAALGFPHLLRTWNYFSRIGEGEGEAERYRAFVRGRARAFAGRLEAGRYPAATAIGGREPGLVVHALAARVPAVGIENPRQLPAWRYPPRYGRVPPAFSRATLAAGGLLLISGTASVIGHESRHPGDLTAQFEEAWRNLKTLCALAAERAGPGRLHGLRVYLREQERSGEVLAHLPHGIPYTVLHGEICRRELLVELEGAWAPLSSAASSPPAADD